MHVVVVSNGCLASYQAAHLSITGCPSFAFSLVQKFNISNPTTGAQKVLEVEDERKLCAPSCPRTHTYIVRLPLPLWKLPSAQSAIAPILPPVCVLPCMQVALVPRPDADRSPSAIRTLLLLPIISENPSVEHPSVFYDRACQRACGVQP